MLVACKISCKIFMFLPLPYTICVLIFVKVDVICIILCGNQLDLKFNFTILSDVMTSLYHDPVSVGKACREYKTNEKIIKNRNCLFWLSSLWRPYLECLSRLVSFVAYNETIEPCGLIQLISSVPPLEDRLVNAIEATQSGSTLPGCILPTWFSWD